MLNTVENWLAKSVPAYTPHPLASTESVTIEMEYDPDARAFVTYVKELHGMSSFGESEDAALDHTAEMIRGYIQSMDAQGKRIPLSAAKLADLKKLLRIDP